MSEEKGTKKNLLNYILAAVAVLLLIMLIILIVQLVKKNNNDPKPTPAQSSADQTLLQPSSSETGAQTEEVTQGTSEMETDAPTETTTDATTTATESTEPTVMPSQSFGKWSLDELPNDDTPYGNSLDDVDENGIPNGVFWYTAKWGQYNVDFVSDIGQAVHKKQSTEKTIYLTMDCGFDNDHTGPILDILKEKNVKATFFVTTMFYDARPDLIKRMIDEGHRIGSHSINHKHITTLSIEEQTNEIMDVVNKLKKDYNYDCRLFRFPEGMFSDRSLALVENLGLKSVFWTYAYNDYSATQPDVQPSYDKAVKYLHPGAIYLLHASSSTNRAFLGDWIDAARNKGYEFGGVYPVD